MENNSQPGQQKPVRLWPGIAIVIIQWLLRFIVPDLFPGALVAGAFSGIIGGITIVIWWLFFSRAPRFECLSAVPLTIAGLFLTSQIIDKSLATAMMGKMFPVFSIPVMSLAFVAWAVVSSHLTAKLSRISMIATILAASGFWALLRTNGMDSEAHPDFTWRWATTTEERLLAHSGVIKTAAISDSSDPGQLRPYFNDFIIHNEDAFGFDGPYLTCIDIEKGTRKWKEERLENSSSLPIRICFWCFPKRVSWLL